MKHIPMRMCIACRNMYPQNELIRIVRDSNSGEILLDSEKKLFGRGAYICRNEKCVQLAAKKRGLDRHFKCSVPANLYYLVVEEAEYVK